VRAEDVEIEMALNSKDKADCIRSHPIHGRLPVFAHAIAVLPEMRVFAERKERERAITRTRASSEDIYIGCLGECVWFCYRYGAENWLQHAKSVKNGDIDDPNPIFSVEVKTSKTFNLFLAHLMVREDYAHRRSPDGYVLVLFSNKEGKYSETIGYVVGYATQEQVLKAELAERLSRKTNQLQGYKTYNVPNALLHRLPEPYDLVLTVESAPQTRVIVHTENGQRAKPHQFGKDV